MIVSLNGEELAPNADGAYTIPGGEGFVKINAYAVQTVTPDADRGECAYCGKVHPNNLWGAIIAFFHMIFAFFKNLLH